MKSSISHGNRNIRGAVRIALAAGVLSSLTLSSYALAADASDTELEEVVVTGTAIKRTDAETAVPLTILKVDDLRKQGLATVEQILGTLTGNQASNNTITTSQAVGLSTGGVSQVDLHGLGASKTLVLLNGRRVADSSFTSSAADLNSIPIAAIERIEVLRDGASSLYGTDAIGGVINFITKKDYQGLTGTIGYDKPQHPGGTSKNANIGGGFGDLDTQGFNIFAFGDFQKQDNITGTQRDFNTRFPGGLSPTPAPANFFQDDGSVYGNPLAPSCEGGVFTIPAGDGTSCEMTTSSFVDYIPKSERESGYLKGELKIGENNLLTAEYTITRSEVKTLIAGVPYGLTAQNPYLPDGVTPNPYYPGNSGAPFTPNIPISGTYTGEAYFGVPLTGPDYDGPGIGCTGTTGCNLYDLGLTSGNGVNNPLQPGFVWVKWRDVPNGPRGDDNISISQRGLLALDGSAGNWDYGAGLSYNHTKTNEHLISGYGSGDLINEGILDGIINPYGDQDAAGSDYVDSALLTGLVLYGIGKTTTADAHISNNKLGDWFGAGRDAAFAVGVEYRHEDFLQAANYDYAVQVSTSTGIDPNTYNGGKRNIYAGYLEMNVPLHETLDLTLAGRTDHYSDFGTTTNPKVSLRWQPIPELVLRAAASTGFRAPSLYDLHSAQAYTNTSQIADPVTCPGGAGSGSAHAPNYCADQFVALSGGNENLEPEKSKSFTAGFVAEPVKGLSVGADYWFIRLRHLIGIIDESTLLDPDNLSWSSDYIHRNPNGVLSDVTNLCPGPNCGYVDERTQNPGGMLTDGIDWNADYSLSTGFGKFSFAYNSTWINRYHFQNYPDGPWETNVGVYPPTFRWQHQVTVGWKNDSFQLGTTLHNKTGYVDIDPTNVVKPYTTLDIYGGWDAIKGLNLTLGVRNLFDKDPPLSYQTDTFQAGYDPRFYDPTGRTYYGRITYNFDL